MKQMNNNNQHSTIKQEEIRKSTYDKYISIIISNKNPIFSILLKIRFQYQQEFIINDFVLVFFRIILFVPND
jgi:hypothetical protein